MYDLISSCLFNKCCVKSVVNSNCIRIVDLIKMNTLLQNRKGNFPRVSLTLTRHCFYYLKYF